MSLIRLTIGASLVALAGVPAVHAQTAQPAQGAAVSDAQAEPTMTLQQALVQAYNTNPDLQGERAGLRANDENVPIARAAGRPSLGSTGGYTENLYDSGSGTAGPARRTDVGLDLSVPVYTGGAVRKSVRAAEKRIEAGRAGLRSVESDLFVQVVTVYVDVLRDEAVVRLNQQNVKVLEVNLQATRDRFEAGDLTRTDVAQSEARLALARGQLRQAEAQLISSRERFIQVVGVAPGRLAPPPALPNLPESSSTAVQAALNNNPALEAAERQREASGLDVDVARTSRSPRVSVGVGSSYYNYLGSVGGAAALSGFKNDGISTSFGVQLSLPLFQGGRPAAQIRQAQAREAQAMEQVTSAERQVVAAARSAYAAYQSSLRVIESSRVAVEANRLSLEGVRAENSVGNRTILDILNAEQELLNSQVQYVSAERDAYVAGFTLLAVMGMAEASDLGLDGGVLYDPTTNYDRVQGLWWDRSNEPDPEAVGTRTVDSPAQTPDVPESGLDPILQRPVDSMGPYPAGGQ